MEAIFGAALGWRQDGWLRGNYKDNYKQIWKPHEHGPTHCDVVHLFITLQFLANCTASDLYQ